jgi:hypothetical protein
MRIEKLWVVCDATPDSELADICFETDLAGLHAQFQGGLSMAMHPTLFTERAEAETEAQGRLLAMRAARAIVDATPVKSVHAAAQVVVLDADGTVLIVADLL